MNAVREIDRAVEEYNPPTLAKRPGWLDRLDKPVRVAVEALLAAQAHVGADAIQQQIVEALRGVQFETIGERADDAVMRGMAGEPLSRGDWYAIQDCTKSRLEAEARERDSNDV